MFTFVTESLLNIPEESDLTNLFSPTHSNLPAHSIIIVPFQAIPLYTNLKILF